MKVRQAGLLSHAYNVLRPRQKSVKGIRPEESKEISRKVQVNCPRRRNVILRLNRRVLYRSFLELMATTS